MTDNSGHLSLKEKIGYGFGDFASVLFWQTISLHLIFFYTDVFGITAKAAGFMILITRFWDGINDPMMGMIADRTKTRWGKFRPYLLWMCVPLAIMAVLTFSSPDLNPADKLIYAYITYTLFMMLYTAINIPYSSLLGVITPDTSERTVLSSFKYVGAYAGGLVISAFLLPLVKLIGGSGNSPHGWTVSMSIFAVFATIMFLITFFSTRERVVPPPTQKTSILRDLSDLFKNTPWILMLFTTLAMILFVSLRLGVTNYYFKYYIAPNRFEELVSVFNTVGMIFSIAGVVVVSWFAKILGKKRAFIFLFILANIFTMVFMIFTPENIILIMIFQALGSFTGGPLTPLIWAMYADTADYSEWKNGRRATGLVFSASTMSQKFGWSIGAALTGWLLDSFGYVPNIIQPENVILGIRALMSIIPGIAGFIAVIIVAFYNLDDKKMKVIQHDLELRRAESGP
jgi:GPH family glycoside/pentoside/hexuronide:cation symporter